MSDKVTGIIIAKLLEQIEKEGTLPWQTPYKFYNTMNWYTGKIYRGINRMLLPYGEYITLNQLKQYNERKHTNFRIIAGEAPHLVVFTKITERGMDRSEYVDKFGNDFTPGHKGYHKGSVKVTPDGVPVIQQYFQRFTKVWEISQIADPDTGDKPVSHVQSGAIKITYENPRKIVDEYFTRETGLKYVESAGVSSYSIAKDLIRHNPNLVSEAEYFSTLFHEMIHSTIHPSRLDRVHAELTYAEEECVAEIGGAFLCAESGIYGPEDQMVPTEHDAFENSAAYLKGWMTRISDWGGKFFQLVGMAETAFYYVLGDPLSSGEEERSR